MWQNVSQHFSLANRHSKSRSVGIIWKRDQKNVSLWLNQPIKEQYSYNLFGILLSDWLIYLTTSSIFSDPASGRDTYVKIKTHFVIKVMFLF